MASSRWTIQQYESLMKNRGLSSIAPAAVKAKIAKPEPEAISDIKQKLTLLKIPFKTEHRFHPTRKFRFDIALIDYKIAVEYEGIISAKNRHTNIEGFTNDCRKYNLAQSLGWEVLRYTALNYKEFLSELEKFIKLN
jgi:hypothetical protein